MIRLILALFISSGLMTLSLPLAEASFTPEASVSKRVKAKKHKKSKKKHGKVAKKKKKHHQTA